jgi:hypothetical protein
MDTDHIHADFVEFMGLNKNAPTKVGAKKYSNYPMFHITSRNAPPAREESGRR